MFPKPILPFPCMAMHGELIAQTNQFITSFKGAIKISTIFSYIKHVQLVWSPQILVPFFCEFIDLTCSLGYKPEKISQTIFL